jgi:hypothetical protein
MIGWRRNANKHCAAVSWAVKCCFHAMTTEMLLSRNDHFGPKEHDHLADAPAALGAGALAPGFAS